VGAMRLSILCVDFDYLREKNLWGVVSIREAFTIPLEQISGPFVEPLDTAPLSVTLAFGCSEALLRYFEITPDHNIRNKFVEFLLKLFEEENCNELRIDMGDSREYVVYSKQPCRPTKYVLHITIEPKKKIPPLK
jgi:hypothetical protein